MISATRADSAARAGTGKEARRALPMSGPRRHRRQPFHESGEKRGVPQSHAFGDARDTVGARRVIIALPLRDGAEPAEHLRRPLHRAEFAQERQPLREKAPRPRKIPFLFRDAGQRNR